MSYVRTPSVSEPTVESATTSNPDRPSGSDVKMSPEVWEQSSKMPYLTKVWEATEAWSTLGNDEKVDAELISEHFKESKDYRKDEVGYKDFLRKFEHLTDTKSAPLQVKIKKISEFIRYIKRTS